MSNEGQTGLRAERAGAAGGSEAAARTRAGMPPSVELHIEEIVLHGFEAAGRYAVGEAVQRELARLFAEEGLPPAFTHDAEVTRVNAGTFAMNVDSDARWIGAQVAQSVYRSLKGDA